MRPSGHRVLAESRNGETGTIFGQIWPEYNTARSRQKGVKVPNGLCACNMVPWS